MTQQSILITGVHRSGTTWVGTILTEAPSIYYLHKPFSVTDFPYRGICNIEFQHWFTYITKENEHKYYQGMQNTLNLNYDWWGSFKTIHSFADVKKAIAKYQNTLANKHSRILVKDPIAFFSAPWLAERFNMKIVVLILHRAAFASSLMKLKWEHPFQDFLAQPLLLKEIPDPLSAEIEEYAKNRKSILEQACLLWKIIYNQAFKYQQKYPDWIFIRHEDLSRDTLHGFEKLCQQLNLEFTSQMCSAIEEFSSSQNPPDTNASVGSEAILKRYSQLNIFNWKTRLTSLEITKIRKILKNVINCFTVMKIGK